MKTQQRLSDEQMAHFDTFGFLAFPGLLADCVDRIIEEFEGVWAAHGGGHHSREHGGTARSVIFPFPDQSEYLSSAPGRPTHSRHRLQPLRGRVQLHKWGR